MDQVEVDGLVREFVLVTGVPPASTHSDPVRSGRQDKLTTALASPTGPPAVSLLTDDCRNLNDVLPVRVARDDPIMGLDADR